MHCLLDAKRDHLTLWNVNIVGDLFDAHLTPIEHKEMYMTCYFNLGIDAEIGASKQ
jgi:hypothetical protein